MAISRAQLLKELLPGLNALFGMEYAKYGEEHAEIFETESSTRTVLLSRLTLTKLLLKRLLFRFRLGQTSAAC
jgi:hypothetical protein